MSAKTPHSEHGDSKDGSAPTTIRRWPSAARTGGPTFEKSPLRKPNIPSSTRSSNDGSPRTRASGRSFETTRRRPCHLTAAATLSVCESADPFNCRTLECTDAPPASRARACLHHHHGRISCGPRRTARTRSPLVSRAAPCQTRAIVAPSGAVAAVSHAHARTVYSTRGRTRSSESVISVTGPSCSSLVSASVDSRARGWRGRVRVGAAKGE